MEAAKQGDTVKVHVIGKLEDGEIFSSTVNGAPLQFTIGKGKFVRGFENGVVGMSPGEKKTLKVPSDQAFGPHRDVMVIKVDRKNIPPHIQPKVGLRMDINRGDSEKTKVTITEVSESSVTVDANNPLAGKDLIFDIDFLEITSLKNS